jgi:hypothetical protein
LQVKKWDARVGCDFYGRDFLNRSSGDVSKCGDTCVSNGECTHFTFTFDGICLLKRGRINFSKARQTKNQKVYCGIVLNKSEEIAFDSNSNKSSAFGKQFLFNTF